MDAEDKREFDESMDFFENRLGKYEVSYEWIEKGMFLTEKDAKDHLRLNHYHYSSDAHTYIKHAWRASDLERFFIELFNHFDIPQGNTDLRLGKYDT